MPIKELLQRPFTHGRLAHLQFGVWIVVHVVDAHLVVGGEATKQRFGALGGIVVARRDQIVALKSYNIQYIIFSLQNDNKKTIAK